MTKSILIITYYWPPSGGAAVQRWLSFANKLAEAGWEVHLLTVDERFATYQLRDESLVAAIYPGIQVHTTKTSEPFGIYKSLFGKNSIPKPAFADQTKPTFIKKASRFIRGNFFIPDPRKGWKKYAVAKGLQLIDQHKIKNVITAGPPHSTHFIGDALRQQRPVKWIADFHDLWTDVIYYNMLYHLPFVKRLDKRMERFILERADLVLTVGEKYKQKLLQKSELISTEKISIMRIGYDETLFQESIETTANKEFTITYTGSIADFYQPQVFFKALREVVDKHLTIAFKLRFVGVLSQGIRENIIIENLLPIFEETGYVSHKQSIQYLYESDVLLLVNPVTKDEAMVIPGKIYEYLAVQKPIINITKKDAETAAIIESCQSGKTFERSDQNALEDYLNELILEWCKDGKLSPVGIEQNIKAYSRREITNTIIQCLDEE
ncbi:MAG: glycosyltransferase family 4 protein [Flaviaesturariibacter sp.]|nr:glycosyltransferase family 4 protein [Flaviaesturariibacter sp.]